MLKHDYASHDSFLSHEDDLPLLTAVAKQHSERHRPDSFFSALGLEDPYQCITPKHLLSYL